MPAREQDRPDPDALLAAAQAEEAKVGRAKLRLYLGYAPGVGKTFAMLEAAHRLKAQGVDVVVGVVESHGREATAALIRGLELLPRRVVMHRGARLADFDLEAALQRRPAVLLVDELAHSVAPGGRHAKRWQEVLELLAAGIEVHTTLNIQHLESLADAVAGATGVLVAERVPDLLVDRADGLELIDLPPEELRGRLAAGQVYLGEAAERASANFFQPGKLVALRELALRRLADRVEADVVALHGPSAAAVAAVRGERLVVAVGPGPGSAALVRATRRLADGLHAPWIAVAVDRPGAKPLAPEEAARLEAHLRLAEGLGAEVARIEGERVAEVLVAFARRRGATRLLMGKPAHTRWRDRLFGSLIEDVVRLSGPLTVQLVGDAEAPDASPATLSGPPAPWLAHASAAALVLGATAVGLAARGLTTEADAALLYVAAIMLSAARLGRGPGLLASALSVAAFDLAFVPPYGTFAVSDTRHLLSFGILFAVGLLVSGLAERIRRQASAAQARALRVEALYGLTRALGSAEGATQVAEALAQAAAKALGVEVLVALPEGPGKAGQASGHRVQGHASLVLKEKAWAGAIALSGQGSQARNLALTGALEGVARWAFDHAQAAGPGSPALPGAPALVLPLLNDDKALGVLALATPPPGPEAEARNQLEAMARLAAGALARVAATHRAEAAAVEARGEATRSALLASVSHDLRTPLGAITGAATTLLSAGDRLAPGEREALLSGIADQASRLEKQVAKLLEMTRLEAGAVDLHREWVPVEELVGGALTRQESALEGRPVATELPDDLPALWGDPVLLEQALANLLENAAKHTPAGSPVALRAWVEGEQLCLVVADRGPGLPQGQALEALFEKFVRGPEAQAGGTGLGLAIVRAIARAHGGQVEAGPNPGGGARFVLRFPLAEAPPWPMVAKASAKAQA